jgi:TatD DNase family protein
MFIDSHCHLSFPELSGRIGEIRDAMATARVDRALCICTTMEEFPLVHGLAMRYENFWATVGVHPDNEEVQEPDLAALVAAASLPRVVAIGETGLDYYQMAERKGGRSVAEMEWQRERFRVHIRAARSCGLPMVIHTRAASDDTLGILRDERATGDDHPAGGVFHCFTETREVARTALDFGYYVSFSGIITFKSATELRDVVRLVPLDRMLIETDSPYLAPVPFRGKTNEPSYVPWVAKTIAEVHGVSPEVVGSMTSENFHRLFKKTESAAA